MIHVDEPPADGIGRGGNFVDDDHRGLQERRFQCGRSRGDDRHVGNGDDIVDLVPDDVDRDGKLPEDVPDEVGIEGSGKRQNELERGELLLPGSGRLGASPAGAASTSDRRLPGECPQ